MSTFFIKPDLVSGDQLQIVEDAHHILHVLRYKIGDQITCCDGSGHVYEAVIEEASDSGILCSIKSETFSQAEPSIHITLFQGLPKSDKMEWILQKNVELGVSRFVPVRMHRSVVKYDAKKEGQKTERWQKIVESAAKQSGRGIVPEVTSSIDLSELCKRIEQYDQVLLFYENAREASLKRYFESMKEMPAKVAIVIGPEGGFEASEVERLEQAGAVTCGLGPRILRTETAGMTAVTAILYQFNQM